MSTIKSLSDKCLLIILDGYGISQNETKNAIKDADTPTLDTLFQDYPFTTLQGGGELVGLPKGVAGNSEVGHMNLGAGRPVRQDLVRINEAIENKSFATLPKLKELIEYAKTNSNRVHLMGLLSDGGVHSHIDHLKEIISALSNEGIEVLLHAYMDGRDTPKTNGVKYLQEILDFGNITFASIQGRSIGMDRDRRWEKIECAYKTIIGSGDLTNLSPMEYIQSEYDKNIFDEFITPALFDPELALKDKEAMFFINFRPDRAKQISYTFCDPSFNEFEVTTRPGHYLCMTPYIHEDVELPILFDKEKLKGTMSDYLSSLGKKQLKIAETEKYAHVTYFFNGGETKPFVGENQILIPSPKEVATYDEKPSMSAAEVTEKLLEELDKDYTFLCVNFANSDMVGHTGNYEAAIKAVEFLDQCVQQLTKKTLPLGITTMITADHGNSDEMVYHDGAPHTSHTKAPVPFCVVHSKLKGLKLEPLIENKALKDVSPTVLYSLGIDFPESFSGTNIFG